MVLWCALKPGTSEEKTLKEVWAGGLVGWGKVSWNDHSRSSGITKFDGDSDLLPPKPTDCVARRFNKGTMVLAALSPGESCPSIPCPKARQLNFSQLPCVLFKLLFHC